mmetsp:Transcript_11433/g.27788  ORF Transcript_11433/g.27788 Transcript_11433/m.27788 type:complete len:400 (+) Transcript_11433:3-1202(+)
MGGGKRERRRVHYGEGPPLEKVEVSTGAENISKTNGLRKREREYIIRYILRNGVYDLASQNLWRLVRRRFKALRAKKRDVRNYVQRLLTGCGEDLSKSPKFADGLPKDLLHDDAKMRELVSKVTTVALVRRKLTECVAENRQRLEIEDYGEVGLREVWRQSELGKDNSQGVSWDRRASDARLLVAALQYGLNNYQAIVNPETGQHPNIFPSWTRFQEYFELWQSGEASQNDLWFYEKELQEIVRKRLHILTKAITVEAAMMAGDYALGQEYAPPKACADVTKAAYKASDTRFVVSGDIVRPEDIAEVRRPIFKNAHVPTFEVKLNVRVEVGKALPNGKECEVISTVRAAQIPPILLQRYYQRQCIGLDSMVPAEEDEDSDYGGADVDQDEDEDVEVEQQ